jgi:hypothetical protein
MGFLRAVFGFGVAVVVLTALAVIFQTGFVLSALADVGAQLSLGPILTMILDDLIGFGPIYGALIAIGLLVAFPAAAIVHRLTKLSRVLVFAGAGLVCMLVMLVAMEQVFFGVQLVAGARTLPGLVSQMIAGAVAGWAFVQLTPSPRTAS